MEYGKKCCECLKRELGYCPFNNACKYEEFRLMPSYFENNFVSTCEVKKMLSSIKFKFAFAKTFVFVSSLSAVASAQGFVSNASTVFSSVKTEFFAIVGEFVPVIFAVLGILIAVCVGIKLFAKGSGDSSKSGNPWDSFPVGSTMYELVRSQYDSTFKPSGASGGGGGTPVNVWGGGNPSEYSNKLSQKQKDDMADIYDDYH